MTSQTLYSASGGPRGGPQGAPHGGPRKRSLSACVLLLLMLLLFFFSPMDVTAYNTALSAAGGGPSLTAAAALAAAASVLLLPLAADGKKVFGIARGGKFAPVGDFCFSVPPGMTGALVAETMLQEEGHELLIHSKSAAEEYKKASINAGLSFDVQEEEGGEGGGGGGGGGGDKSLINTCNALHNNARVRETLAGLSKEELSRGAPPAFFELNLAVDSSMDGQEMTAWITRCAEGQTLNAAYSVTFLNPGGFFTRQFSCQDQGLLQLYMVMSFLAIAICASSYRVYKQQQRQTSPLAAAATCCCCILGTSIVLQTFHLIVYAADGIGLPLLKFLHQLLQLAARSCGLLLFLLLSAKGVDNRGQTDHRTSGVLSMVALGVVAAALMSLLGGTFFPDELNPASLYTTVWALPLHIITGVASVLIMVLSLLNAEAASLPVQRNTFLRLCFWGTTFVLSPLFVICFLSNFPLMQAYVLLTVELVCLGTLQRIVCRGNLQTNTRMGEVKSPLPAADLPYTDL